MRLTFCLLTLSLVFPQSPRSFNLTSDELSRFENSSQPGLASNGIVDIRGVGDSLLFFGTGRGLGFGEITFNHTDSIKFGYFDQSIVPMPYGGNPALAVFGDVIAVSGIIDTALAIDPDAVKGTGISYSTDAGATWTYLPQPIDSLPPDGSYQLVNWGGQEIPALAVTTEIYNISYDLAVNENFIYAASWAGGFRRFDYTTDSDLATWDIIPMPLDENLELSCGDIDTTMYEINPRDPYDGGSHNHKGFSVMTIHNDNGTDWVWAGSAAGINKGKINGNCIDWENHYTSLTSNISGNWVVGLEKQVLNTGSRIWAITWATQYPESHALSYTDDAGDTWHTTHPSGYSEKVYNLYSFEGRIWAASESGLYATEDGEHWERYNRPVDNDTSEEILAEPVLSVYLSEDFNWLWEGSSDGLAVSPDDGISWTVHRFWESAVYGSDEDMFSAYPNPFFINDYNQVGGDGFLRFVFYASENIGVYIDIFDFAMDRVVHLNHPHFIGDEGEILWNGRNEFGDKVTNGVYFCRLYLNGSYYWTKVAIIN